MPLWCNRFVVWCNSDVMIYWHISLQARVCGLTQHWLVLTSSHGRGATSPSSLEAQVNPLHLLEIVNSQQLTLAIISDRLAPSHSQRCPCVGDQPWSSDGMGGRVPTGGVSPFPCVVRLLFTSDGVLVAKGRGLLLPGVTPCRLWCPKRWACCTDLTLPLSPRS